MTIGSSETSLVHFRHFLHSRPELSGSEKATAQKVADVLSGNHPANLIRDLGGLGVAAEFRGGSSGPRIMLRCDMDALPIDEDIDIPHASVHRGVSHKCGHDGHMATMLGVAAGLSEAPPSSGSVVLLFQPGEETGRGALDVLRDGKFKDIRPDMVFALHNLPGFPRNSVIIREGPFASASRGMTVELEGVSSHASEPHLGRSPAMAVAQLIEAFTGLPQTAVAMDPGAKVTVIHAMVGRESFGTSPGEGRLMATLRTHMPCSMTLLSKRAEELAGSIAEAWGLRCTVSWSQEFPPTDNDPSAVNMVLSAASELGMEVVQPEAPFPWSEDFGHFTSAFPGALFGLGAGTDCPALHTPGYDFPDALIVPGVRLFMKIIHGILHREE